MHNDLASRIQHLEEANRRLTRLAWVAVLAGAAAVGAWALRVSPVAAGEKPIALRAHELVITDENGVERVRIAGDLPDAVINGRRVPRGDKAAGVILYDTTGQERGGYVTFQNGNAVLTLDTRREQVALLAAGANSGSAFELRTGADGIGLRSDSDGSRLTAVREGKVALQEPEVALSPQTCNDYRDIRARTSLEHARRACQSRFLDGACGKCLEK